MTKIKAQLFQNKPLENNFKKAGVFLIQGERGQQKKDTRPCDMANTSEETNNNSYDENTSGK